jgi:hypothetical protein
LIFIASIIDEIGGIDIHERASYYSGDREPEDAHYLRAVRDAIDAALWPKKARTT